MSGRAEDRELQMETRKELEEGENVNGSETWTEKRREQCGEKMGFQMGLHEGQWGEMGGTSVSIPEN